MKNKTITTFLLCLLINLTLHPCQKTPTSEQILSAEVTLSQLKAIRDKAQSDYAKSLLLYSPENSLTCIIRMNLVNGAVDTQEALIDDLKRISEK